MIGHKDDLQAGPWTPVHGARWLGPASQLWLEASKAPEVDIIRRVLGPDLPIAPGQQKPVAR